MDIYEKIEMALEALRMANNEYSKNPTKLNKHAVDQAEAWLALLEDKARNE